MFVKVAVNTDQHRQQRLRWHFRILNQKGEDKTEQYFITLFSKEWIKLNFMSYEKYFKCLSSQVKNIFPQEICLPNIYKNTIWDTF